MENEIPLIKNRNQQESIHKDCSKNNVPYLVINAGTKYGSVEYDMITCNFDLNDKGITELKELFNLYKNKYPTDVDIKHIRCYHPILIFFIATKYNFYVFPRMKLNICSQFGKEVESIINNTDNLEMVRD